MTIMMTKKFSSANQLDAWLDNNPLIRRLYKVLVVNRPQTRKDRRAYQYNERATAEDLPLSDVQARD